MVATRAFSGEQRPVKYGRNFVKSPEGSYKATHLYIHSYWGVLAIDSIGRSAAEGGTCARDGGALVVSWVLFASPQARPSPRPSISRETSHFLASQFRGIV